ncbi:helix-turn-helix domain-containing protein [Aquimarina gracilis]|uniref:Helix-turn-helix domain-containing protein n=1 Tax=Aquimarina gracilis TaxID=874422 RepID=A0ABU6A0M3_9FLAO|nr:helix-turn-helix domain-containing protein [Aquimarina gracilis]MEB3347666.1 helix-turn-helix domain-containing protein [Aquimarina gracilis]
METVQSIIDQIPIRHNAVSYFIFMGIFVGFLLSSVILFRTSKKGTAFKIFGWSLLIQTLIATDVFLCYTGLIKYAPHLNDSTEPLVLLLAPSIYLFVYTLLERKSISFNKLYIHLLPAILYFISQIQYYLQPISIKINAYLGAYFPNIKRISVPDNIDYTYLIVKDELRWFILFSFVIYILLSLRIIWRHASTRNISNAENLRLNKYNFSRNTLLLLLGAFVLIFVVFLNFEDDAGDHYIFIFHTLIVTITSFVLLSESRFFEHSWLADKYETTRFKPDSISMQQIKDFVEHEQFYLSESASLKNLATSLGSTSNYISQIINTSMGLNFNDFINSYRIDLSKKRLMDPNYQQLTIEGIGNSVGFKSRSSFYNAFKKHVKMSPKAFLALQDRIVSE